MKLDDIKSRINEGGFEPYVADLLKFNYFEGDTVIGIAKKIVHEGVRTLTEKQINTFIYYDLIKNNFYQDCCVMCTNSIPWEEMLEALEDGFCSYCRHIYDKTMKS